jgi:hypothetical protein
MRAVSRRLCLDWYRSAFGRARIFDSIARLSGADRDTFRMVHQQSLPLDEALAAVLACRRPWPICPPPTG